MLQKSKTNEDSVSYIRTLVVVVVKPIIPVWDTRDGVNCFHSFCLLQ